jgi:very-short-patch-repair endonuclease
MDTRGADSLPLAGRAGVGGWMATDLSRKLRRQATPAEAAFWTLTYSWRQAGWHFRRQFQLGSYYVDFVCIAAGLIVEIDGDTHGTDLAVSNDALRDDYLSGRGFAVMRFSNRDVLTNADGVFSVVASHLETRALIPPPQPSPRGGGSHIERGARSRQGRGANSLPLAGRAGVGGAAHSNPDEDHE